MDIIRTFHPVGQGGFYTETFNDRPNVPKVVFDCGGKSKEFMEKYIDSFLPSDKIVTIEAVFISHLHDDHINGLQHLLDKATVKKIFLPQFNSNQLFDTIFYNAAQGGKNSNSNQLVLSLIGSTHSSLSGVSIIQVAEAIGDNNNQNVSRTIQDGKSQTIASGTPMKLENGWVYIPFNPKSKKPNFHSIEDLSNREKLEEIYQNEDICKQAEYLVEFIKGINVSECKKLYKQMFGGIHNGQSMTLFSGLRKHNSEIDICSDPLQFPSLRKCSPHWFSKIAEYNKDCIPTNFLYTGDYKAGYKSKMRELINFYEEMEVWNTICGVQIPHHGSRKNYAKELYNKRCYAIASAGSSNKYRHPNIDTLINIFRQFCMPLVVTDNENTILVQRYKI